ncbi:MAG: radical SAM protein [Theionarchaea archaeon]|nr:radical SAM protein [Theionarchaea archaeon]MBU7000067.1 radical SAM protein [Theionarchaea archaeon]MBU7021635.1 radical SAM protein [Theionarchaea archaeon]MBU7034902.1 radical SAM protein [Theionarchaea archaeon]MBU7039378.1 radical SAM protein [Theionarchaea archaeon]
MKNLHSLVYSVARAMYRQDPYKVTYAVTYQCNARCKICNIWKKYVQVPQKKAEELTLPEIGAIFSQFDLSWVSLTGGEPFLRDDLVDIVSAIEECSPHLSLLTIPTNGSLPETARRATESILEETRIQNVVVTVSVDGDELLHDELRGVPGLWKKARTLYHMLSSMENDRFSVLLEFTVSKHNAGYLDRAIRSFGADYSQVVITAAHSSYFYRTELHHLHNSSSAQQVSQFNASCPRYDPRSILSFLYTRLLEKYLKGTPVPLHCVSGRSSFFLDPYGVLYPCITMETPFGSLREDSLHNLLKGERASAIIHRIRDHKCPGCWTPCEAYQTIVENLPRAVIAACTR